MEPAPLPTTRGPSLSRSPALWVLVVAKPAAARIRTRTTVLK
jgi:hypothetical protein